METDIQIDYDLVTSSRMRDQSVTSLGPLLCNLYEWEEDFLMCLHSNGTPCWPSVPKVVGSNPAERPKAMNREKGEMALEAKVSMLESWGRNHWKGNDED